MLFKELDHLFAKVIQFLPEDQQAIFAMSRDKQMTYKEIATEKNILPNRRVTAPVLLLTLYKRINVSLRPTTPI